MDHIETPPTIELATQANGRDITQPFIGKLLENRDAVLAARGGSGSLKIYEELLTDDQVFSTFQQRKQAVVSKDWGVTPASDSPADVEAADFIKEMFTALDFDDITSKAMFSVFFGYGVGEFMWKEEGGKWLIDQIIMRDRARFRFGSDGKLYLITRDAPQGELMPDNKFWILSTGSTHDDAPYGLGLAHYLYWPVFFKRNGLKFWLKFLEKYGTPTVLAKAPGTALADDAQKKLILEGLRSIQQDAAVLVPDNIDLTLIEAKGSGATSHEDLKKGMDRSIAKIVLSQTMTSDAEGGQYKADVHKEVRDEVIEADANLISESLNRGIITLVTALNFPNATPPKIWRDVEPAEDDNKRAERDEKIYALGFDPTEEYIADTYGPGWEKRQAAAAPGTPTIGESDFAELAGRIAEAKNGNRSDQEAIAQAARKFAADYQETIGGRVEELVAQLDEHQDLALFEERINEMLAEAPPAELVESIERATFMSRMMGLFRAQQ